jgi:biopolymer transport protein ExbD
MFTAREARGVIRKAVKRVPEGEEIRHLNIVPMMDMMTILLVTFIFQAAVTATALTANQVHLASSLNEEPMPEDAATLIISESSIVFVDADKAVSIVAVRDGDIDASEKEGGALGLKITKLTSFLANYHQVAMGQAAATGHKLADPPELLIIADRATPFRVLHMVMFSAKQKEAGYKRFRLIVQKHHPGR